MAKILIIDIETTGFLPNGKICEIGAVELDLSNGKRKIVFDQVISPDCLDEEIHNSWIVKNGYMTLEEMRSGKWFAKIQNDLQKLINSYGGVTAFNRKFDVDFLQSYGIEFPKLFACPMLLATNVCKLPGKFGNYKWPKVEEAYKFFFPDSNYVEKHRGSDDAMHEAEIVYELYKIGVFKA